MVRLEYIHEKYHYTIQQVVFQKNSIEMHIHAKLITEKKRKSEKQQEKVVEVSTVSKGREEML